MANDLFIEDEAQLETEEDIGNVGNTSAVLSAADWTTETILTQINKGNIQLNPSFQRRDAWDRKRKSRFIESLVMGLPIPQLVLAESKTQKGAFIVLDGKQRLLSIRQFSALANDNIYTQLKLEGLEVRRELVGKSLVDLKEEADFRDDVASYENQPIRTVVIKNWADEKFLYRVFLRLNTGSVSLSPQELRQALHPGPFVKFLDEASGESVALKEILNITTPDFRMRDAELLLRYYGFNNFISDYTGSLKPFLDDTCSKFNNAWEQRSQTIFAQLAEFENAHRTIKQIFREAAYRKWSGNDYERRFNRAIFDVMILTFCKEEVRAASAGLEPNIEGAFKHLCAADNDFLSSIESTTKSLGATHTRLSKWFAALNQVLNIRLQIPNLINNRII